MIVKLRLPHASLSRPRAERGRRGSTLTEVLVAVLIMAIGIVSVASMFPLAALRAAQASQLTHATVARLNADAWININERNLKDPDLDSSPIDNIPDNFDPAVLEHRNKKYIIDPHGFYMARDNVSPVPADISDANGDGNYENDTEDIFGTVLVRFDSTTPVAANLSEPLRRYPIDGSLPTSIPPAPAMPTDSVAGLAYADHYATLQDSYIKIFDARVSAIDTTTRKTLTLAGSPSLGDLLYQIPGNWFMFPQSRVTIFDQEGLHSETRTITGVNTGNNQISFEQPVPARIGTPGSVRVETQERRYTWLLTVTNSSSGALVIEVVVFFRRSFEPHDEYMYMNQDDSFVFTQSSDLAYVRYPTALAKKPWIRKGGWCFDPIAVRWYRILKVDLDETTATTVATIKLNAPARGNGIYVMFPKGVVDVYPIASR